MPSSFPFIGFTADLCIELGRDGHDAHDPLPTLPALAPAPPPACPAAAAAGFSTTSSSHLALPLACGDAGSAFTVFFRIASATVSTPPSTLSIISTPRFENPNSVNFYSAQVVDSSANHRAVALLLIRCFSIAFYALVYALVELLLTRCFFAAADMGNSFFAIAFATISPHNSLNAFVVGFINRPRAPPARRPYRVRNRRSILVPVQLLPFCVTTAATESTPFRNLSPLLPHHLF